MNAAHNEQRKVTKHEFIAAHHDIIVCCDECSPPVMLDYLVDALECPKCKKTWEYRLP